MNARKCACIEVPWRAPLIAFAPLSTEPYAMLFGPGGNHGEYGRWSILLAQPEEIYEASGTDALSVLPPLCPVVGAPKLPFIGGYAGLLSYELGASLDKVPRETGSDWPDLAFGDYPCAAVFDHHTKTLMCIGPDAQKAKAFAKTLGDEPLHATRGQERTHVQFQETDAQSLAQIKQVIALIHAGDIFQANISRGFQIDLGRESSAFDYFRTLCAQSPAPFSAWFRRGMEQVLISNSPEQFFAVNENGDVQTSPIKGTRPRSSNCAQDQSLAKALLNSAKDRSENLMIVDLMRNDLSRVCKPGSIKVPEHCALKSYTNVHHLVSRVEGQLQTGKSALDVLTACFPAGSITGAPKIRAMEIIAQIEKQARGPYYGSLGYISRNGIAQFNVLIRTAEHTSIDGKNILNFRTGGGIVADSDPASEVMEMRDKARALCRAAGAEL